MVRAARAVVADHPWIAHRQVGQLRQVVVVRTVGVVRFGFQAGVSGRSGEVVAARTAGAFPPILTPDRSGG